MSTKERDDTESVAEVGLSTAESSLKNPRSSTLVPSETIQLRAFFSNEYSPLGGRVLSGGKRSYPYYLQLGTALFRSRLALISYIGLYN